MPIVLNSKPRTAVRLTRMSKYDQIGRTRSGEPNKVFLAAMGVVGVLLTLFVLWVAYLIWGNG